jgi:hypothetical protein
VVEGNSARAVLKFLKFLNRLRLGHSPISVEYEYDFKPRWQDGGNPFIREVIARQQATIDRNIRSLNEFVLLVRALSEKNAAVPRVDWRPLHSSARCVISHVGSF